MSSSNQKKRVRELRKLLWPRVKGFLGSRQFDQVAWHVVSCDIPDLTLRARVFIDMMDCGPSFGEAEVTPRSLAREKFKATGLTFASGGGGKTEQQLARTLSYYSGGSMVGISKKIAKKLIEDYLSGALVLTILEPRKKRKKKFIYNEPSFTEGYKTHIKSDDWRIFCNKIKIERGRRCEDCGSKDRLHVHHLHYRTLGNEKPEDVRLVCKPCHERIHGRKF